MRKGMLLLRSREKGIRIWEVYRLVRMFREMSRDLMRLLERMISKKF